MSRTRVALAAAAVLLAAAAFASPARAQQVADSTFLPVFTPPAYARGAGPVVLIDEAHHNFHTMSGRYAPFARTLEADGFVVRPNTALFSAEALAGAKILVISNAIHAANETTWVKPILSAFTTEEIAAVKAFVQGGGSLLLIADHMPFAGAAKELGLAFRVRFDDGFAVLPGPNPGAPAVFKKTDGKRGSLREHLITRATATEPAIDSVATFTGSAFLPPGGAASLLTFPDSTVSLSPDTAWVFRDATPKTQVTGWAQGAVFGEAAMFTAQLSGGTKMGMNAPSAPQNAAFLSRVMRWLATGSPAAPAQSAASK